MLNKLILSAIALRAGLLLFGSWQDTHLAVKYTDIDYEVYTDAAQFMVQGGSPYQRSTYRYSPLLAALLTPNILLHKSFGKVLFALADIVAALLMQRLLHRRFSNKNETKATKLTTAAGKNKKESFKSSTTITTIALALWLFSPFTVSISTRGNGEALVTCMLLGMLDLLENNFILASGLLYGLAVHWRVYPIIYALPILKHLAEAGNVSKDSSSNGSSAVERRRTRSSVSVSGRSSSNDNGKSKNKNQPVAVVVSSFINSIFSLNGLKFGLSAACIFLSLGIGLYRLYGFPFLHETYLYHATRVDPRHNFSPYHYPAYLGTEKVSVEEIVRLDSSSDDTSILSSWMGGACTGEVLKSVYDGFFNQIGDSGKIWTLATLVVQFSLGWVFSGDLAAAFFLQTVAFVAFNKVATAQYFVWYFSWLPLVLPSLLNAHNKVRLEICFSFFFNL
jgi:phosphatidylinositol glycan class M